MTDSTRSNVQTVNTDVVVAGGGPAGFAAAVAAARNDADVILVERYGFLGGMATAGLVTGLPKRHLETLDANGKSVVEGIVKEILERLEAADAVTRPTSGPMIYFDPEEMKYLMLEMAEEAGVYQMLHTRAIGAIVENDTVSGIVVESKSGRQEITAMNAVDATGDGDIAAAAGALFIKGRECDGITLPMTLIFSVGSVNNERFSKWLGESPGKFQEMVKYAVERGELRLPKEYDETGFVGPFPERIKVQPVDAKLGKGLTSVWGAHVFRLDCSVERDLTKAEIETRRQAMSLTKFLRNNVPGFESARIALTATQVGVRESRRFVGEYVLSEDDIRVGATSDDVIARSIVYETRGTMSGPQDAKLPLIHDIPYRCLIPQKIDGMLLAGRCISTTQKAQDWTRNINTCMTTGQAAGTAAALSSEEAIAPRQLDVSKLQQALIMQGVNLGKRFQ